MFRSYNPVKLIRRTLLTIIVTSLLTACQTNAQVNNTALIEQNVSQTSGIKSRILNQYANWKGVRYRLGGTTKKGIDCSALVQVTFREQFGLNLPRTTDALRRIGQTITKNQLKPGDLVHFQTAPRTRHVGIYIGNNQFMHASSSKGVMISSLDNSYWKTRYKSASRVLTGHNARAMA